jgi:hypothetical protein
VAAVADRVSTHAHGQGENQHRRQDGGKKQLAHSNHLLCGTDQCAPRGKKPNGNQSANAADEMTGWGRNSLAPAAQAIATNLTPPRAAPTLPATPPTQATGTSGWNRAIATGIETSKMAAHATTAAARVKPRPASSRSPSRSSIAVPPHSRRSTPRGCVTSTAP